MLCYFAVYYPISLIFWPKIVQSILSNQAKFEQNWLKMDPLQLLEKNHF